MRPPPNRWLAIFGQEPIHGNWCYTIRRPSLARQAGDWPEVSASIDQAQAAGQMQSAERDQSNGCLSTRHSLPPAIQHRQNSWRK